MSEPINNRILRVKMSTTASITSASVAETVTETLKRTWGCIRHGSKLLARQIDTNERTIMNLIEGRNAPSSATLLRLMKEDDAMFDTVMAMIGRQAPAAHQAQLDAIKEAIRAMEGKNGNTLA